MILCDYTKPPVELPLRYHELIAARVVRDGLFVGARPFDMLLDQELPVELGRLHYGLPKRYDASLRVHDHDRSFYCEGHDCSVVWKKRGALLSLVAIPLRLAFGLSVWLATRLVDVLGTGPMAKRARIVLRPYGWGDLIQVREAEIGSARFYPLWAGYFSRITTQLGSPREMGQGIS